MNKKIHQMRIAGVSGEILTWEVENDQQVAQAEAEFAKLVNGQYYQAYAFKDGEGAKVTAFDKTADKIVLMPQSAGG